MKRFFITVASLVLLAAMLSGCGDTKPAAASANASATSGAGATPTSTAPTSVTPVPDQTPDAGGDPTYKTTVGDWEYSLNMNAPTKLNGFEAYYIHRKKGTEDIRLDVPCFKFSIYGNYIYAHLDSSKDGGFIHWKTYRYDLSGGDKKAMDYTDMTLLAVGGKLYFTCFNDMTIYTADLACENVQPLKVEIPDAETIAEDLKDAADQIGLLTVQNVQDGWINFIYQVADKQPSLLYNGRYRVNLDGSKVEKLDEGSYSDITI